MGQIDLGRNFDNIKKRRHQFNKFQYLMTTTGKNPKKGEAEPSFEKRGSRSAKRDLFRPKWRGGKTVGRTKWPKRLRGERDGM